MKNFVLLSLLLLISAGLYAQECDNQRYYDEIFDSNVATGIKFGEAPQPLPLNPDNIQELFMDVYQPNGDTLSARPLIIWAFGGGFVAGSKSTPDIVALSTAFAQRGYVCAAIDYRLSTNLVVNGGDVSNVYEAVLKAIHDMRASIRFFYKDAATVNTYKIDTARIYIGGVSAGAITALQIAHFDELSEVPAEMEAVFQATGGFEGTSGNPGYADDIAGVISLCGAVLDTAWINPAITTPIVSMHGTADSIVPYGSDVLTLLDIAVEVDGSYTIHSKLDQHGIPNNFYTWPGANHTPFVLNFPTEAEAYMDTTISFVRDFLYDLVCDNVTSTNERPHNEKVSHDNFSFEVFPNPSNGNFFVQFVSDENYRISIFDNLGRRVFFDPQIHQGRIYLALDLPKGVYFVKAHSKGKPQQLSRKIIVH